MADENEKYLAFDHDISAPSSSKTGLDAQHIASNLAHYESARSGFFTFTIDPGINNIVKASYKGDHDQAQDTDKYARAQEDIQLNVLKCDIPHFSTTVLKYRRGNEEIKFAGVPEFGEGSLVVDDIVGLDTKGVLMAWQAKTYNVHTRKGGRMVDYKFNCTLTEYTQDYEPIRSWRLYGCWPSQLQEDPFDRENDDKRRITATIQYDRAVPEEAEK